MLRCNGVLFAEVGGRIETATDGRREGKPSASEVLATVHRYADERTVVITPFWILKHAFHRPYSSSQRVFAQSWGLVLPSGIDTVRRPLTPSGEPPVRGIRETVPTCGDGWSATVPADGKVTLVAARA